MEPTGITLTAMTALQANSRTRLIRLLVLVVRPAKLLVWELTFAKRAPMGITKGALVKATVSRVDLAHLARESAAPARHPLTLDVSLACRARRIRAGGTGGAAHLVALAVQVATSHLLGTCLFSSGILYLCALYVVGQ